MDVPTVEDTLGALLTGAFVSMAIYGITTLQVYFYYLSFPRDSLSIKLLVAIIWMLDTLHVIFMCHSVHYYVISQFGNRAAQINGIWSLFTSIGVNVLMGTVVQCFFSQRIHLLCSPKKRWWISTFLGFTVMAHFCLGIETVVLLFSKREFSRLKEVTTIGALPFAIFAILSDIFIALALCILLHSNRSEFEDTNNLIRKLIVYAVNRCILTTAMAFIEVVAFIVLPNSFYTFAIDFVIGKLYANSLLAALNSRKVLRGNSRGQISLSTEVSTSFNLASVNTDQQAPPSAVHARSHPEITVDDDRLESRDKESRQTTTISSHKTRRTYPGNS